LTAPSLFLPGADQDSRLDPVIAVCHNATSAYHLPAACLVPYLVPHLAHWLAPYHAHYFAPYLVRLCAWVTSQEQEEAARLRRQLSEARANTEREYLDLEEQLAEAERSRAAARAELEHMEDAAAAAKQEWEQQVCTGGEVVGSACLPLFTVSWF
jgi:hypothetical protein